jgi:aminoglycoside 6'-N-acetyltransferase I
MPGRVRLAGPADAAAWCELRRALWPDEDAGALEREVAEHFAGGGLLEAVFLAEARAGAALGMLEMSLRRYADGCTSSPVPYIEGWYVVPHARRQGVGRVLVSAAEAWARERGYTEVASDDSIDNLVSERAHWALGFAEVERLIVFRKDLQSRGDRPGDAPLSHGPCARRNDLGHRKA